MSARRYLRHLAIFTLLGVVLVISTGAVVDPYGLFKIVSIARFNAEKTERLAGGGRLVKSIDIHRKDFDTLILGSSRTLQGINPDSPAFRAHHVYNGAVPETDMHEVHLIGLYALRQHRLKRLIVGVDLHMFLTPQSVRADFLSSAFTGEAVPLVILRRLLSIRVLTDSAKTIVKNALGRRSPHLGNGALDQGRLMQKPDHWGWFEWRLERLANALQGRRYVPAAIDDLRDLVVRARELGMDVKIFISPTHAVHLETLSSMGLFPIFEQWKRDVTSAVTQANETYAPGPAAQLWDFSGYNRVTTEPVPSAGDDTPMQWYWELSHYKEAAGDLILAQLLRQTSNLPRDILQGFGIQLTQNNIEKHLESIRAAQLRYRAAQLAIPSLLASGRKGTPSSN